MPTENTKANDPFINKLIDACDDPGSAAALRKYWSPTTAHYAYPILGRLRVPNLKHPDAITAAIYSINPNHKKSGNSVGKACLQLAGGRINASGFDTFEPHMQRLLASTELDDLKPQLRRISIRLKHAGIHIDYNRLMWDLRKWNKQSDKVKTQWAMQFWQAPAQHIATEGVEA